MFHEDMYTVTIAESIYSDEIPYGQDPYSDDDGTPTEADWEDYLVAKYEADDSIHFEIAMSDAPVPHEVMEEVA